MPEQPHIRGPEDFAEVFDVSRETVVKLEVYASLLRSWQKTINLVAPSTLDDLWHRHFADSAQLAGLAERMLQEPSAGAAAPASPLQGGGQIAAVGTGPLDWLDLGSGAGFPGLIAALVLTERRPGSRVTLIEADQRKCAFLREVARQTGAPVDILSIRIEKSATRINLPLPDVVSARALAPLTRLLQLSLPFLASSTIGLFPKGRDAARELAEAQRTWRLEAALVPSLTDPDARIVTVRGVEAIAEGVTP
jgi:16S rRNA (guanine527-N7)-methyltransferase